MDENKALFQMDVQEHLHNVYCPAIKRCESERVMEPYIPCKEACLLKKTSSVHEDYLLLTMDQLLVWLRDNSPPICVKVLYIHSPVTVKIEHTLIGAAPCTLELLSWIIY